MDDRPFEGDDPIIPCTMLISLLVSVGWAGRTLLGGLDTIANLIALGIGGGGNRVESFTQSMKC